MKSTTIKSLIALIALVTFIGIKSSVSQPPPPGGPPCWPPPCGIPLDGGITFLAAAGIALAGKKLYNKNNSTNS
ncbi:MAG: hypothetical protein J0M08_13720 [Bacteroidetes bacterium]|nr:hypothetical protein [Bacteroidota bacterium]